MKAIQITKFGPPEVLTVVDCPTPEPGEGQVLIRTHSSGLNPIDWKTRKGLGTVARQIVSHMPWVPGFEVAGVVEKVGPGVVDFKSGDTVMGICGFPVTGGGYAEYAIAKSECLIILPTQIAPALAGGIPLAALTAWQALFVVGNVTKEDIILIHAAAGGVGHFALQFAKWKGANVITTASEANFEYLKSLGADEVIDYKTQIFDEECENLDYVLDGIGGETGIRSLKVIKPGGTLVTLPTITAEQVATAGQGRAIHVLNFTMSPDKDQLTQIAQLIADGTVKVNVTRTFKPEEAPAAHELLESGRVRGKLLFNFEG